MSAGARIYSSLSLILLFIFTACGNTQAPEEKSKYQKENEAYIDQIDKNSSYTKIQHKFEDYPIYYKVLKAHPAENDELYPYQNSEVRVHLETKLITGEVVMPAQSMPITITQMQMSPRGLWTPQGPPKGLQIALLNMSVGDQWEVVVPWQLGYERYDFQNLIPGYSTLIYTIELLEITKR